MKPVVTLLLLASLLLALVVQTDAYCVYNKLSNRKISVHQRRENTSAYSYSVFSKLNMEPGAKECCPYTNSDCSKYPKTDVKLYIDIYLQTGSHFCITYPSGGWIDVLDQPTANHHAILLKVYNADGSLYPHEYLVYDTTNSKL